jgi:23S rRNA pseudouridine1911/1915/1917 synthase
MLNPLEDPGEPDEAPAGIDDVADLSLGDDGALLAADTVDGEAGAAGTSAANGGVAPDIIHIRFRVPPECAGWRLDHFLKSRIRRLSRTKIQQIIAGQVRLEGARPPRAAMGVRAGEVITIDRPAPVEPEVPRYFTVIADDPDFIAIDKPAGLPIHATAKYYRNTLTMLLRERYPGQGMQVCHRIDRETSGVLLIARGLESSSFLKQAFARRKVTKTYLALVHGHPPDDGVIDKPLKLEHESRTRLLMVVTTESDPAALRSVTRYKVRERYTAHTLVECFPETGRQHQIRVHLASIGHPIVGDKIYRASEAHFIAFCDTGMTPELLAAFDHLPRQALHAHQLTFPHPRTKLPTTITSPLPADLTEYIAAL